jgi:predicted ATPase/class 3 adenylate cyclase
MEDVGESAQAVSTRPLPSGTVTFLFSDIEGSTQRWETHRQKMQEALQRHDTRLREQIELHGGAVFKTVGDAFYAVFTTAADAIAAALDAQRALVREDWSAVEGLRVRMAIHTGATDERGGDYFGSTVNRVARLLAIGHGGQIIVSGVTADLVQGQMPSQTTLHDLGAHRLKDLAYPEQVYQVLAPDLPREFPPLRSLGTLPNNLPLQLTSFVGRDEELAEIEDLLSKSRLVTIVGSGGVGKSRTSLQVAADRLDAYPDGVWFVELASITDPELIATSLATALGVSVAPTQRPIDAVLAELTDRTALLIFDNCEHLVAHAATVIDTILRHCPHVTILASSREGLGIAGESVYRMPSLRVPGVEEPVTAASALQYGAMALFTERAAAVSNFTITDANATIVADVCRRLDGIALAIELAAPRLKVLSVDELDKRLSDRFRILTGGSRNALPRQQTLRALIDWSYDLLDDSEKTLFRRIGVFVDGFTLEAMTAVCADERIEAWDAVDLLQSLVEKSLVVAEIGDAEQRYRLLESTRQYALERLARSGENELFSRQHAAYFLHLAQRSEADYPTRANAEWRATYQPELGNFRTAIDWALSDRGDVEMAALLVGALTRLWRETSLDPEGLRACEAVLQNLAERSDSEIAAPVWLGTATLLANLYLMTRRLDAAQRALRLYETIGDDLRIADSLREFGDTLRQLGRAEEALGPLTRSLELSRRHGDRYRIAVALGRLALPYFYLGDVDAARTAVEEARRIFQSQGRDRNVIVLSLNLGEIEASDNNFERAVEIARDALSQTSATRFVAERSTLLSNLSGYLLALGRLAEATAVIRESITATRERQETILLAVSLQRASYIGLTRAENAHDAVRVLAYVDATFEALGSIREPLEQREYDRLKTLLRELISDDEMESLTLAGRSMEENEAIATALALLD